MKNFKTLQNIVDNVPNLFEHFYHNNTKLPHYSRADKYNISDFIPNTFTNWRDEQHSWGDSVGLLHQSHHMSELYIEGPDALQFLERMGINSMKNFTTNRPKQYIVCSPKGHVIGDGILHRHGDNKFELVSGMPMQNWLMYHAEMEDYDLQMTRDLPSYINKSGKRTNWRFQLVGPNAVQLLEALIDEPALPEHRFFHTFQVTIRGCKVLVLRHGMTGQGAELSGPFEEEKIVRDAILDIGKDFGIVPVGTQAYFSATVAGGWMSEPVPGIFTDSKLKSYRKWLPSDSVEARIEIGGSFVSDNIEDCYVTPYDLGYSHIVKFDHEFIGREALENLPNEKKRAKVSLVWDRDDVQRIFASQFGDGPRYKSMELPILHYAFNQFDEVRDWNGQFAGVSCHAGYINPVGEFQSLAMLHPKFSEPGTQVVLTWGEPNGGSRKPQVEEHTQTTIRATVIPEPLKF